ncbi:MAG TPA: hypothetical protein PLQ45_04980 [Anaerohalosphaeraceae bacterium]|jgi:hypothetical protein|nr:hypothetical protein [Anaerohalosphaeraceae bacterium]
MKICQYSNQCSFLLVHDNDMPKLTTLLRKKYCRGQFEQCARYQVFISLGSQRVPAYMLPSQTEWAEQIIKEQKSACATNAGSQNCSSQSTQ